jgi:hypothetical protein
MDPATLPGTLSTLPGSRTRGREEPLEDKTGREPRILSSPWMLALRQAPPRRGLRSGVPGLTTHGPRR